MNQREASRRDWRTNSVTGASIEEINVDGQTREERSMTRRKIAIEPIALDARQAAQFLNCSLTHFHDEVRKHVPFIDMRPAGSKKPMLRWMRTDLEAFLATRRKNAA